MFARKYRLPAKERLKFFSIARTPFFTVKISKNNLSHNRYGFVAGKEIDNRATVRNRLKRRIRSCVEKLHPGLKRGYDFLFLLKKDAVQKTTEELFALIEDILKKSQ